MNGHIVCNICIKSISWFLVNWKPFCFNVPAAFMWGLKIFFLPKLNSFWFVNVVISDTNSYCDTLYELPSSQLWRQEVFLFRPFSLCSRNDKVSGRPKKYITHIFLQYFCSLGQTLHYVIIYQLIFANALHRMRTMPLSKSSSQVDTMK